MLIYRYQVKWFVICYLLDQRCIVVDSLVFIARFISQPVARRDNKLSVLKSSKCSSNTKGVGNTTVLKFFYFFTLAAARSNSQTSIYSPAFYSSPFGYKICLRLYLNGDGNAQGTHMSLFIVIMRSEFDAILKYPFDFKVIFCLFDQTNQKQHIIDAFIPDAKSNSFQRPHSDMNVGGGITKFAPLKLFERDNNPYIRDDTMFIKAMIDFGNIPKNIFQSVFSLNPALTNPIQQEMIQMESEKQQQQQSLTSVSNAETN